MSDAQETAIQIELWKLIETYQIAGTRIWHVPNGEKRDIKTAKRLKEMGVVPGVLDLHYFARMRFGMIELKKPGGRLSKDQRAFMEDADANLIRYDVAYSVFEAANILQAVGVINMNVKFTEGTL